MYLTTNRYAERFKSLLPLICLAVGCSQPIKPVSDGNMQKLVSETPSDWNDIDDITIYYWSRSDKPEISDRYYDKHKLIDEFRKLTWDGPPNEPPPPKAPYWEVAARAKGKPLFHIFVADSNLFFVTNGDPFANGRYADPKNCWLKFRDELKASHSEFADIPPWE